MVEGDNSKFIITVLFKVLTTIGSSLKTFCDWIRLRSKVADLIIVVGRGMFCSLIKEKGIGAQPQPHA